MNGEHDPVDTVMGLFAAMTPTSDLDEMRSMLESVLGNKGQRLTETNIAMLRYSGADMSQVPNMTFGEFGVHWLVEHRGYGDPVHPCEIVKWSEREDPIFLVQMQPNLWTWTFPCHNEHEFCIADTVTEQWGTGTFKVLTQDEIDQWWTTFRLPAGWHDLRPSSPTGDKTGLYGPCIGKVYINKAGEPDKVQWFKDGHRHTFKDAVALASAMSGYEITCFHRYDDKKKTTKLVHSYTRREPPMQHPNGKPA